MLCAHGVSDVGPSRGTNEDCYLTAHDLGLYVVADGMGGHAAGEVASRLAVEAIEGFIRRSHEDHEFSWPYGYEPTLTYDGNRLKTAVCLANRRVFRLGEAKDDYTGMGTTVVATIVDSSRLVVAHVGDSRLYLLVKGKLEQVTRDDTWVEAVLANTPGVSPAELTRHPMRHVLTNVVGSRIDVEVHVAERSLSAEDRVLLCTDGLHGPLDDAALARLLADGHEPKSIAQALVSEAIVRGSRDNITAVVILGGAQRG
jgi:PPM family protein phosphatase